MIDERYVLTEEKLKNWKINERLNAEMRIKQSRDEFEEEARLVYDIVKLKVIQYFFYNSDEIFSYWTINGEEYDKTHFKFERGETFIQKVFPIVCRGLAMFLLKGIQFYFYNHKVKEEDFILEKIALTSLTKTTSSPFRYIIFNKEESVGFDFFFDTGLLDELQKIMIILENKIRLNNTPSFRIKKLTTDELNNMIVSFLK